jgi:hypothetical protein
MPESRRGGPQNPIQQGNQEETMPESVYKVI